MMVFSLCDACWSRTHLTCIDFTRIYTRISGIWNLCAVCYPAYAQYHLVFYVHKLNSSVIYGVKLLIQCMIVVGILYMIKFSVDVLRVKSGDTQEHPWVFLLLLGYALYAFVITRIGVSFIRRKWAAKPEEIRSGRVNKLYNEIARRLLKWFGFPGIPLNGLSLIVLSTYTGLFIIGVTFVYGLLATDFINWLSSFNRLSYPIYLSFTMFIYIVSPLFFIAVQLSLPEVKRKGKEVVQLELYDDLPIQKAAGAEGSHPRILLVSKGPHQPEESET